MSGFRKWWAVTGSDPIWWLTLPPLLLICAAFGPLWIAAWAIRKMEDWPDWLEDVGGSIGTRFLSLYRPRREARIRAWRERSRPRAEGER